MHVTVIIVHNKGYSNMKQGIILFVGLLISSIGFGAERLSSEAYIEKWKVTAIEQMNEYAIPASITLAQGILESGSGNSELAKHANNHFGIKCHKAWNGKTFYQDDDETDECFRSYEDASLSYIDHSLFLTSRSRYSNLFELSLRDYKSWAKGLKQAGYATNPKYADLLITIIERYSLDDYDNMPNLPMKIERERQRKELKTTADKEAATTVIMPEESKETDRDYGSIIAHDVQLNKYKVRYIVVHEGDTFYRISKEFDVSLWQLYKYNELGKRDVLKQGEVIYLDPKRSRAKKGYNVYVCPEEMTLREVSQHEGIKLKKLMQYNMSEQPDEVLPTGTKVILR